METKLTLIACGNHTFCNMIRKSAIENMASSLIKFIETEYHPRRIDNHDVTPQVTLVPGPSQETGKSQQTKDIMEVELQDVTTDMS